MRDGLAREFPEAGRAVAWTRARIGPWTEPVVWAAISGIGAGFLVSDIGQALVGIANQALQAATGPSRPSPFTLFPLVTIAGSAAAAAVALGAGGPLALALELAYNALGIALRIPGVMTFCERSGGTFPNPQGPDQCTAFGFLAALWPQFVGIGLGIVIARTSLITRGEGTNSLLRVAGALAIAVFVVSEAWGIATALRGYAAETAGALTSTLTIAAGLVAAAVAAGVIAAQLPRGVRNAVVVAGLWLLPWLVRLPTTLSNLGSTIPTEFVGPTLVSIVMSPIAAAFLVLSAAIAARSRFVPREPA